MTKSDKTKYKYFNGRKYSLRQGRWYRTETKKKHQLSHDVWNYYYPEDKIQKEDKSVIHHINENPSDDRIENLLKIQKGKHITLHRKGKSLSEETKKNISISKSGSNHPDWRGGVTRKSVYLCSETIEYGLRYTIYQYVNSFGEIKSSGFIIDDSCRTKKENE